MQKKQMLFKTKGMNQDLSVSAFNPEFSFENMNLRLSTNEGNTLMSWVNEKGTAQISLSEIKDYDGTTITGNSIQGTPVGTAVLNHKLVLFTVNSSDISFIYVFGYTDSAKTEMRGRILFRGNLGLDVRHPIETHVSYEAESIQKVYWTDGKNQPRMINIAATDQQIAKWTTASFDFVPVIKTSETMSVARVDGGGLFEPGVIQYCFTYYNKHGQQSNIVDVSPLFYLSHSERGARPDEKVTNSFSINITNADGRFDYVRLYSIHRTSVNAEAIVKILADLPIQSTVSASSSSRKKVIRKASGNDDGMVRTLVYSDNASLTLPKDSTGHILTATLTGGTYNVTVIPIDSEAVFSNAATIKIVCKDLTDEGAIYDMMTLQSFLDLMASRGLWPEQFFNDYHAGFRFEGEIDYSLHSYAEAIAGISDEEQVVYGLSIVENGRTRYVFKEGGASLKGYQLIYNYKDQNWYVTNSQVLETVTKDSGGETPTDNWVYDTYSITQTSTAKYTFEATFKKGTDTCKGTSYWLVSGTEYASIESGGTITTKEVDGGTYPIVIRAYCSEDISVSQDITVSIKTSGSSGGSDEDTTGREDSEVQSVDIVYTDNGTTGSIIDPKELLYAGGREIHALTMSDKDNTLFLGNIELVDTSIRNLRSKFCDTGVEFSRDKTIDSSKSTGIYSHNNTLTKSNKEITTFKGGETYRFGFQLQSLTGEWTEPIWLGDKKNPLYPESNINESEIKLALAKQTIDLRGNGVDVSKYRRARPLIVYPTIGDRNILYQGVLNPTVFNMEDRKTNSPYAQASWFFRPYMVSSGDSPSSGDSSSTGNSSSASKDITVAEAKGSVSTSFDGMYTYQEGVTFSSIDSFFISNGYKKSVWIMLAECTEAKLKEIVGRPNRAIRLIHTDNYFNTNYPEQNRTENSVLEYPIWGIVSVGFPDYSTKPLYAFMMDVLDAIGGFGKEYQNVRSGSSWEGYHVWSTKYEDGITPIGRTDRTFLITDQMRTVDGFLYYVNPTENPTYDTFDFRFFWYVDANGDSPIYTMTFNSLHNNHNNSAGSVITDNTSGEELAFTHYASLLTSSEIASNTDKANLIKQVEIQGSKKIYSSPFSLLSGSQLTPKASTSNTQFFIDQSIVTLNSPDIEFDTEVQTYGTEGLKMRVVGVVPITANASAHRITHGSMLETNHNINDSNKSHQFGSGENDINVIHYNRDSNAGKRLVADYLWNDVVVESSTAEDKVTTRESTTTYVVHPWHKTGSLNTDSRKESEASSWLKTKKMSHLLFSLNSHYLSTSVAYENISSQIVLAENAEVMNYRLPNQRNTTFMKNGSGINYYPNIDKVLFNEAGYTPYNNIYGNLEVKVTSPISMKYKSCSHAVIGLNATGTEGIPLLPYDSTTGSGKYTGLGGQAVWGDNVSFDSSISAPANTEGFNFLWIGEVYKESVTNRFGGDSESAILNNRWQIGGDAVDIQNGRVELVWDQGDTYYQRYDALKTYPYTNEDTNQLVEILSFMCETHINIDGRYDRNRGQVDSTNVHPGNFNLLNPIYTQQNNFFTYKQLEADVSNKYPNQVYFSKTKQNSADVDLWTNITLASTLVLDGDKGEITKLTRFNDQLIAFQDSGIAQILANNMELQTTNGVALEIANSGKVQGMRYLSDTVGCSNKWSICNTPSGIYFMDSNEKSIYLFNGQLQNISTQGGFNTWCKQHIPSSEVEWSPATFDNFRSFYDRLNQEVLFVNNDTALAWSEKLGAFTSFYDYGGAPYLCSLDDTGLWVAKNSVSQKWALWKHQAGAYGDFFGVSKPYWMTLVGNPEPQADKIFTNIEFRACVDGEGQITEGKYVPYLPFDSLESWNEYQHGQTALQIKWGHSSMQHNGFGTSSLKRKFRIWRCDIPRDNIGHITGSHGIQDFHFDSTFRTYTREARPMDRMRNPWIYLKLSKGKPNNNEAMGRTEIHDLVMTYFG